MPDRPDPLPFLGLAQCHEAAANIQRFEAWVAVNPWLEQVKVDLAMP